MNTPISPTAVALLTLMSIKGVGRRSALKIVSKKVQDADPDAVENLIFHARNARLPTGDMSDLWRHFADQLIQFLDGGIQAISFHDDQYPTRLRAIPDPPAVLFVKGALDALHADRSLAVVGTREPTVYGEEVSFRSAQTAAQAGFVIVSGLALGCDTQAHKGCLAARGVGLAVLAHGLDKVYPAANRDLAERLLDGGGCLVSEYPCGVTPIRSAFAERDRIQSGLSDGLLVIETDVVGGTMHTVRFCREQKRRLACISHPAKLLSEPKTQGNQKLISDRVATPIADGKDLVRFLESMSCRTIASESQEAPAQIDASQMTLGL